MIVNLYYVRNDRKYNLNEFSVNMNHIVRDNQSIIMFMPDPVNKLIISNDYCLNYFWKIISVDFEIPYELIDFDFENKCWFGLKPTKKSDGEIVYADYIPYYVGCKQSHSTS